MVSPPQQFEAKLDGLETKGRGIYFYHDSNSELPVRNISGEGKKEPYIEYGWERDLNGGSIIGAENHCYPCYQKALQQLAASAEQYLFLLTNPQHLDMERCIVGYIRKEGCNIRDDDRVSVYGETRLYPFEDALPASEYGKRTTAPLGKYGEVFDGDETQRILDHFASCEDVTEAVLHQTLEMENKYRDDPDCSTSGC